MRNLFFCLLLFPLLAFTQNEGVFSIDSLPKEGVLLNQGWKWQVGDNPEWAKAEFDDSKWESIDPTKDVMDLPQIQDGKIAWMRLKLKLDSSLMPLPLALKISQVIASEIYVDGRLLERFGKLDSTQIKGIFAGLDFSIGLPKRNGNIIIAIRFALQKSIPYNRFGGHPNNCFRASLVPIKQIGARTNITQNIMFFGLKAGAFLILFVLHLVFFILYPLQKANLYFSGMALCYVIHILMWESLMVFMPIQNLEFLMYCGIIRVPVHSIAYILLLTALYAIFNFKKDFIYWLTVFSCIVLVFIKFSIYKGGVGISETRTTYLTTLGALYIVVKAIQAKKRHSKLIFGALICSILGLALRYNIDYYVPELSQGLLSSIFDFIGVISIPVCISWFLGADLAFININLETKLKEVQQLSQEKQQILYSQNETLEKQVAARTIELKASQAQLIQSEKLASLGELTAGIAHEIQNPLNFVNNFAEVSAEMLDEMHEELEKGDTTEAIAIAADLKTNLKKINHHGQRASAIVKGMLEHSRASTGVKEPTDLNALADEYLRLAYHGLRAKDNSFNATMETHFDLDLPIIEVIPQDIGRVLLNLINNAFHAVNEKAKQGIEGYSPTVTISSRKLGDTLEISVKDNGNGIPESIKDKIFQPFFTTKPTGQGTGLGLSLAYDIVTKGHGGHLEVETKENDGTDFTIILPLKIL